MKVSKYNFFYEYRDDNSKYIAYNALSNSLALLEKEKYVELEEFTNCRKVINDESFIEDLKKGGYLIEDNFNELEFLRFNMFKSRLDKDTLSLTIAPTSDCNFRCIYCYEKDAIKPCYMSNETEKKIVEYVKKNIKLIYNLTITWYGGEPLLAKETIIRLSKEFKKLCIENDVNYDSNMISNGYLFKNDDDEFFKETNISAIQITLDGDEVTHNTRRPLVGGRPTYNQIIDNLKNMIKPNCKITIRINVDRTNMNGIYSVIDDLEEKKMLKDLRVYLGKVNNINDAYNDETCLSSSEFENLRYDFDSYLVNKGLDVDAFINYPLLIGNVCCCDRINSYVINADGSLYKCWDEIGRDEKSLGNIKEIDLFEDMPVNLSYVAYDPTSSNKCKECNLLPICMGGCHYNRINKEEKNCEEKFRQLENDLVMTIQGIRKNNIE